MGGRYRSVFCHAQESGDCGRGAAARNQRLRNRRARRRSARPSSPSKRLLAQRERHQKTGALRTRHRRPSAQGPACRNGWRSSGAAIRCTRAGFLVGVGRLHIDQDPRRPRRRGRQARKPDSALPVASRCAGLCIPARQSGRQALVRPPQHVEDERNHRPQESGIARGAGSLDRLGRRRRRELLAGHDGEARSRL